MGSIGKKFIVQKKDEESFLYPKDIHKSQVVSWGNDITKSRLFNKIEHIKSWLRTTQKHKNSVGEEDIQIIEIHMVIHEKYPLK